MQISVKLDIWGANPVDILNQRPRLRGNKLTLVNKATGILSTSSKILQYSYTFEQLYNLTLHLMLILLIEFCREMLLSNLYY